MKIGILFSGGKDSTLAALKAKNEGYDLSCLITIESENPDSYMFHTPAINKVEKQASVMNIPLIKFKTKGKKEEELKDLKKAIQEAIKKYQIEGIVTGAVESVYQASRIQKICAELNLECFNPLWQKDQIELLHDLIQNNFEVILTGVFAEPFDEKWLGRKVDDSFITEITRLNHKLGINPAGEGGEFETFVLNCELFDNFLEIKNKKSSGEKNSWRLDLDLK